MGVRTESVALRTSLTPVLAVNFVGTLGFSIVVPFLVFLVTKWGGNALVYGIMGATYSVFQLIGAPILGRWSDRYGRRKILLVSQLGTMVSWIVFLVAFTLPVAPLLSVDSSLLGKFALTLPLVVLFAARALDGLTGGNVSVASAYMADVSDDDTRSANFGKMAISSNLGFIFGPAIAGVLGGTGRGEALPVAAALVISLLATLLILFRLPESRPCVIESSPERTSVRKMLGQEQRDCFEVSGEKQSFRQIVALPGVGLLLALYFLIMLGFNFYYISFPIHAVTGLGWTVRDTGLYFAVMSLMMVVVQGPVLSRASRVWSERTLAVTGGLILAASFVFFLSPKTPMLYTGAAVLALGNGLMWPSIVALLAQVAGRKYQGVVQGFAGSSGAVASIVGLVAGGLLYGVLGPRIFLVSAAILVIVFVCCFFLPGRGEKRQEAEVG